MDEVAAPVALPRHAQLGSACGRRRGSEVGATIAIKDEMLAVMDWIYRRQILYYV